MLKTVVILASALFAIAVSACGGAFQPQPDIDATVEAKMSVWLDQLDRHRVELAKASLVAPTATPVPNLTANEYFQMGNDYREKGEYEKAIANYDEAIRLNPQLADAYADRGLAYQRIGKQELADRDYAKAKELGHDP